MASPSFIQSLTAILSSKSQILTNESSADFKASMHRWTNCGLKVPSAIVQPATEEDVVATVKELVSASVPFVPASGGHSTFSSVGKPGVIIDLSRFTGVEVDVARGVATAKGGTLMKEFQAALHPHKHFAGAYRPIMRTSRPSCNPWEVKVRYLPGSLTAVGSGNTVGVLPYYLGGGISAYTPFCGYGCENIVAATFVTAQGELVSVSDTDPSHDAELLWGVRGAGQFLGLFTQITVKIRPYSVLGNNLAQRTIGTFAFTVDKLDAVAAVMVPLMESKEVVSAGHVSVTQAPPDRQHQVLLVAPQVFAAPEVAAQLFQPLVELGPILQVVAPSTFETHSEHMAYLCTKGGFKRFTQNGMPAGFGVEKFRELVKLHSELVATCPDAARSGFTVEWHSPYRGSRVDTAFGLGGMEVWL